jgi:hypothetical protein
MEVTVSLLVATVITLAILIVAAYCWYNFLGWEEFSFSAGDVAAWGSKSGADDASRLRFKGCVFTVKRGDGVTKQLDVTAVLNGMACGHTGSSVAPLTLALTRPLNPFSFVIKGFNDKASVPDPTAAPWCTAPPALCNTDTDCPGGVAQSGACGVRGACFSVADCPSGPGQTCGVGGSCQKDADCAATTGGPCVMPPCVGPQCPTQGVCIGVCGMGACPTCPGGAAVTLTGKVRTI